MVIEPRATASRAVAGLSPTSTICTRPCASTWDSRDLRATCILSFAARKIERQALERYRQVDALQLDVGRHLQRTWREVEHCLDAGRHHEVDDALCRLCRDGDHRNADAVAAGTFLQVLDVEDGNPAARL